MTEPDSKVSVLILGGGPTGLGAACMFNQAGFDDWVLCEQLDTVGGLARSLCDKHGFTWDIGGHVVFSHYKVFSDMLDQLWNCDQWCFHQRVCYIHLDHREVPYPFQNNIHHLSQEDCARCLVGLIQAAQNHNGEKPENFGQFIDQTFGEGIASLFMRPYNSKVWAYLPESLDADWIAERVSVPDVARVARNVVMKRDDHNWGPNNLFRFPRRGGTGAIWQSIAASLNAGKIRKGWQAVSVDIHQRLVRFSNGQTIGYDQLISTIPLDSLVGMTDRTEWKKLAGNLKHSATHVIGVGLQGRPPQHLHDRCWMYFPDPSVPFYRMTHFSHYSPENVPEPDRQWSLMMEVSESTQCPVCDKTIAGQTIDALVEQRIIASTQQVSHTWTHRQEYGYPTPFLGRDEIVHHLLGSLAGEGIWSRGRFGAWKYEVGNMDHSFMQGFEVAGHLLHATPEVTVWHPGAVNSSPVTLHTGQGVLPSLRVKQPSLSGQYVSEAKNVETGRSWKGGIK